MEEGKSVGGMSNACDRSEGKYSEGMGRRGRGDDRYRGTSKGDEE